MRNCRNRRTFFAWLATCTFVFGALASAVMPLVRGTGDAASVEICTLAGSKWVNPQTGAAESPTHAPGQNGPASHCPWCSLQTPALELPAPARASLLPRVAELPSGHRTIVPPLQARAWALAPSRAPPLSS